MTAHRTLSSRRLSIVALALVQLLSCASFAVAEGTSSTDAGWLILTDPVTLVGDTQEHLLGGHPLGVITGTIDRNNPVTIRPPQHSLFGRKLFEYVATETASYPLVHLGDMLDLSCDAEFDQTQLVLRELQQPWVIVPGNHDGVMNGVRNSNDDEKQWLGMGGFQWKWQCTGPPHDKADEKAWLSKGEWIEKYRCLIERKKECPVDDRRPALRFHQAGPNDRSLPPMASALPYGASPPPPTEGHAVSQ